MVVEGRFSELCDHLAWGRESWTVCFSCISLFVLYVLILSFFSSSWCRGLAAVCDCGTPWSFLLTFLRYYSEGCAEQTMVTIYRLCHALSQGFEVMNFR